MPGKSPRTLAQEALDPITRYDVYRAERDAFHAQKIANIRAGREDRRHVPAPTRAQKSAERYILIRNYAKKPTSTGFAYAKLARDLIPADRALLLNDPDLPAHVRAAIQGN